ncbi:MAG: 1-(5-phosphoribosyl)-5-[(5-phosphoribosylamino)methylideneamino]imidazole-4-carboxamide isomerase [Chloroflexota bacterium]|nr:1-(5-phosphoribosyl)-5-[(5-phosphoribosylamino)methylideneamino]imidazole-4-carboxamide isomerase [Chloroflexota bacterium]
MTKHTNNPSHQFTIYPAIDLRQGQVVRLQQGDPDLQTVYGNQPADVAHRWFDAGAHWLHVVNLDGAFGENDTPNQEALTKILEATVDASGSVQLGGGIRSLSDVESALSLGVTRVILGTAAIENPALVAEAIARFGPESIAVGIDARDGRVCVRGWTETTDISPIDLGRQLAGVGLKLIIYTDISRDGVSTGVNVAATQQLAAATGLSVIASGGVATLDDVRRVRAAKLDGVIIGRALYEGQVSLEDAIGGSVTNVS